MLISKSYWFDKPRFINDEKLLLVTSTPSLGAQPNIVNYAIKQFSGAVAGDRTKANNWAVLGLK